MIYMKKTLVRFPFYSESQVKRSMMMKKVMRSIKKSFASASSFSRTARASSSVRSSNRVNWRMPMLRIVLPQVRTRKITNTLSARP